MAWSNSRHFPMVTHCDLSRLKSQSSEGITPMGLILTTATNLTKITMSNQDHIVIIICDLGSHLWHDYNPPCCMYCFHWVCNSTLATHCLLAENNFQSLQLPAELLMETRTGLKFRTLKQNRGHGGEHWLAPTPEGRGHGVISNHDKKTW